MQNSIILTQYSAVTQYILHNMITSFSRMNVFCNRLPQVVFTTLKIYTLDLNLCAVLETVESTESE